MNTENTIAAISTPIGVGGIAIIRISGPRALEVADAVFVSSKGRPSSFPTHTIHLGRIVSGGKTLDQVMLTVMRAPHTYTTEDVVEINCHGGLITANNILRLCLENGSTLATHGEFTQRAFLNGRLDLTQAEAVGDLIRAQTDRAQAAAIHILEGGLRARIERIRDPIMDALTHVEASLDFPEEDIPPKSTTPLVTNLKTAKKDLETLLHTSKTGRVLREGSVVTIVGRPNVGKSSLMNALLEKERTIVTAIPGTTRDVIEAVFNIKGVPILLHDTAGFRKEAGLVEMHGINLCIKMLERSDLILHVIDASKRFSDADKELTCMYRALPAIHVLNKSDLSSRLTIPNSFPNCPRIRISAKTGEGLEVLRDTIFKSVTSSTDRIIDSESFVNDRHADAIRRGIISLESSISAIEMNIGTELVSQHLRNTLNEIGEISGQTISEDILGRIFSTFCIGK